MKIKTIITTLLLMVSGAVSFALDASGAQREKQTNETSSGRKAVVELSSVYMRAAADYESAVETQELMGTVVEIVGEKGYWREIECPQPYRAWCTELGIIEMSEQEISEYQRAPKVIYANLFGHIYSSPSPSSQTICDLVGGDLMRVVRKGRKWTEVMLPSGKRGFVMTDNVEDFKGFRTIAKGEGDSRSVSDNETEAFINTAMKLLGSPYLWGGMTPKGVDCSGLVRWAYLMNGILLPRNASQMIFCGETVEVSCDEAFWEQEKREDITALGREMEMRIKNLKRGDLVFFGTPATTNKGRKITHVGIYLGDGKMIHSSHLVRINSLLPSEADYYENSYRLLGAIRL